MEPKEFYIKIDKLLDRYRGNDRIDLDFFIEDIDELIKKRQKEEFPKK